MKKLPAKTTCFRAPYGHTKDSVIPLDAVQIAPGSTTGAHMKQQQEVTVSGLQEAW